MASKRQTGQMQHSTGGDSRSTVSDFALKRYGTQGNLVKLKSNFFKIDLVDTPTFYHYNINMDRGRLTISEEAALRIIQSAAQTVAAQPPAASTTVAPKAPAAQSGKAKGPGRRKAMAAKNGIDLTSNSLTNGASRPAANALAANANGLPATMNDLAISTNGANQPDDPSEPPKTAKGKRAPRESLKIFKALFSIYSKDLKCDYLPFFDGEKNFYSTTKLNLEGNCWPKPVYVQNGERMEQWTVDITIPEKSNVQNFGELLKKDGRWMPFELQALDILLRNGPRQQKIALGPNLFSKLDDGQRYDILTGKNRDPLKFIQFGYYQSARKAEDQREKTALYLNVDRATAILTNGGNLIELVDKIEPGKTVLQ